MDIFLPTGIGVHIAQPAGAVGGDKAAMVMLLFQLLDGRQLCFGLVPLSARECAGQMLARAADAEQQSVRNVLTDISNMAETLVKLVEGGELTAVPALCARIRERAELPTTEPPGPHQQGGPN